VLDGNFAKEQNFKGFGATFGLISNNLNEYLNIQGIEEFRISAGYSLKTKLKGEYATYSVNNFGIHDTASLGDAESTVPSRFFAGFSLKFNHRTKIFGDFVSQSWSDYYSTNTSAQSLTNTFKASLGLEYVPQSKASTFEPDLSYRLGVSYEKLPYLILGEPSYRMSAGAGISIPLSPANYVDLGVLYSFNTSAATNAVKDHTISFVVGLSIGELWFLRTDY
jgi:long-subunit fatty acid transport protein